MFIVRFGLNRYVKEETVVKIVQNGFGGVGKWIVSAEAIAIRMVAKYRQRMHKM